MCIFSFCKVLSACVFVSGLIMWTLDRCFSKSGKRYSSPVSFSLCVCGGWGVFLNSALKYCHAFRALRIIKLNKQKKNVGNSQGADIKRNVVPEKTV